MYTLSKLEAGGKDFTNDNNDHSIALIDLNKYRSEATKASAVQYTIYVITRNKNPRK